ncbi:Hypothetical predicted protein, partial [Pelobates cultripes]
GPMYPITGNSPGLDKRTLDVLGKGPYIRLVDLCWDRALLSIRDLLPHRTPLTMELFRYNQHRHFSSSVMIHLFDLHKQLLLVEEM